MTTTFRQFVCGLMVAGAMAAAETAAAAAGRLDVSIGGVAVTKTVRVEVTATDLDTGLSVPAATVTISGGAGGLRPGDPLSVDASDGRGGAATVFKGEIVGIEPVFDASGKGGVQVRAFDKLHRLTRGRKSRTFENMRDSDIVQTIAKEHGLVGTADLDDDPVYDRVYQHNQTDLEFLRTRAARLGYQVRTEDELLNMRRRVDSPVVTLGCRGNEDSNLRTFRPRLSSADQVSKVTVRGWDPEKKEPIIGVATTRRLTPSRGAVVGTAKDVDLGALDTLSTAAQAHAVARAMLVDLTADEIAGEIAADGDPRLMPGARVRVGVASLSAFDGDLEIVEVLHRDSAAGDVTLMRFRRADRATFFLPEVGDEVLVEFVGGDIAHPIVIGSLWNGKDRVPATACAAPPGGKP